MANVGYDDNIIERLECIIRIEQANNSFQQGKIEGLKLALDLIKDNEKMKQIIKGETEGGTNKI